MNDLMMELRTEANCINGVISRILLFHYGDVIWWPIIYFFFYFWGSIYTRKPRNSIQHVSVDRVSSCDFFLSIHIMREFTRYRLHEKAELLILSFYFMSIGNGKALRLHSDTHAALPLLAWAVNSHFPVFLHPESTKSGGCSFTAAPTGGKTAFSTFLRSERRKTGSCSFTAALIGGKVDFPVFLLSERRKAGTCGFTAALIGGKADFPVFPRSERRKTGNCGYAAGTYGSNISIRFLILFFPSFARWWVMGRGLVPRNEGWTCANSDWVK